MDKMIIAAFPASAIKICVQSGETDQIIAQTMFWMPEFENKFKETFNNYVIKEIYVVGPKDYIPKFVDIINGITDIPVIEEVM